MFGVRAEQAKRNLFSSISGFCLLRCGDVQPEETTQTMKSSRRRLHAPLSIITRIEKRSQVERKKLVSGMVRLAPIAEIAEMLTWILYLPTDPQSKIPNKCRK